MLKTDIYNRINSAYRGTSSGPSDYDYDMEDELQDSIEKVENVWNTSNIEDVLEEYLKAEIKYYTADEDRFSDEQLDRMYKEMDRICKRCKKEVSYILKPIKDVVEYTDTKVPAILIDPLFYAHEMYMDDKTKTIKEIMKEIMKEVKVAMLALEKQKGNVEWY